MGRSKTPSHVVTRHFKTEPWQESLIDSKLNLAGRFYNNGVRHYRPLVEALREDAWFQAALAAWKAAPEDSDGQKSWLGEIFACMEAYGLTEYAIHEYLGKGKKRSCDKGLGINIIQKVGSALYASIKKAVFAGTEVHFRKRGQTDCIEDKSAGSGIIYHPDRGTFSFMGHTFRLDPIREDDAYMMEALCAKVKYCRLLRKPFSGGYRYYLQIVLEGPAPGKLVPGKQVTGLDPGVSTMACVNSHAARFMELAPDVRKLEKDIRRASVKYERRRRMANPENYNPDGTIRKDTKTFHKRWKHTHGMLEALMELKDACRRKAGYVKTSHGEMTNRIVGDSAVVIKETMDYKALARCAKKLARQEKESRVKKKDGTIQTVRKFKRKKRFGTSIGRRAPASFLRMLEAKLTKYGCAYMDLDNTEFKASQYDHAEDGYVKHTLSERTKTVGGRRVQRDLYSAYLMSNAADETHTDREACIAGFRHFLKLQGREVARVLRTGDVTGNFGLKDFIGA